MATYTKREIKELKRNPNDLAWDDFRMPLTRDKQGQSSKPDFDFTHIGLLFPSGDDSEIVYLIVQLPHDWAIGTTIKPHIHWKQSNGNNVVWKIDYRWFDNGDDIPGDFTTITATNQLYTYSAGDICQIDSWDGIDGGAIKDTSSIMHIKLYRNDAVDGGAGGNDALAYEFDIHYQRDSNGSYREFNKLSDEYVKQKGKPKKPFKLGAW